MSERYEKALKMANDYLEEDGGTDTTNNANASQIASLNQQIAKIDGQLANLGSDI